MKEGFAPFFGGIYGIDYVKADSSGIREARVTCVLEGGTQDGYVLKYRGSGDEIRMTAAKELHRVELTEGWLDACGFFMEDDVWVLEVSEGSPDGAATRGRVTVDLKSAVITAVSGSADVTLRGEDNMCADAVQTAAGMAGIDAAFPFETIQELER